MAEDEQEGFADLIITLLAHEDGVDWRWLLYELDTKEIVRALIKSYGLESLQRAIAHVLTDGR